MHSETRCVVRHTEDEPSFPGSFQPVDPSTAFHYIDGDLQSYPRYFNTPNQVSVAQVLADLEGAEKGLIFSSGMAAISTTLRALLDPGAHAVFLKGLYGGSQNLIAKELGAWGVGYSFAEPSLASFESAVRSETKVIFVESPTNPLLGIVDLQALAEFARSRSIVTVIDNTFASPINQRPIALGFDVSLHSGTKYLGGHSDLCCGAVTTSGKLMRDIYAKAKLYGGSLNAMSVYLLDRSLRTLAVRVRAQTANAGTLAAHLSSHPEIKVVYYPGLEHHPGHVVAKSQMSGFGAMLAFELAEGRCPVKFLQSLSVIRPALSLGGIDSSICVPATTSHRDVPSDELQRLGITPNVLRFSVGIEAAEDLREDLDAAISSAGV